MSDGKPLLWLALLVLLATVPFLHRAYFVDDFYHVTMARGLTEHPLRPYDFYSDDAGHHKIGWERGEAPRMVNPPLFHFYLAAVIKLFGDKVWVLRASTIPLSIASVWLMFFLGKRFTAHPFAAAALLAVTPAYWLTSYSLLIDAGLIPLFLASLLVYFHAFDRRSISRVLAAGLLMGLALMVKYSGVLVLAVAFLWQIADRDRARWLLGYLAYIACGLVMLAWGVWGILTYGQMHLLATLPRGVHAMSLVMAGEKALVVLAFFSGGTIFALGGYCLLTKRRAALAGVVLLTGILTGVFGSSYGGFSAGQAAQLALEAGGAVAFLLAVQNSPRRFLVWWLLAGLAEMVIMMPWTAARYFLIVLPPAAWLFMDALDAAQAARWIPAALGITALFGGSLAFADYGQANVIRGLGMRLAAYQPALEHFAPHASHRWYFLADTFDGAQPYIEPLGWESVFPDQDFKPGDLFLRSRYRKSSWWEMPHPERFELVARFVFNSRVPLRVMDVPASAGFYASCWGALPFAVTRDPLEEFDLYQVRSPAPSARR